MFLLILLKKGLLEIGLLKSIKDKFITLFTRLSIAISLTLLTISPAATQQFSHNEIKAAYIFNFIKYIEWPNEKNITTLNIGYYGQESAYRNALQIIHNEQAKHFTINISNIDTLKQANNFHMLVLDKAASKNLKELYKDLDIKSTLIISDSSPDKNFTMLNFIETNDSRVIFELNRYQLLNANLNVSPDILVLGGTELDIANVLKETNANLSQRTVELEQKSKQLNQLETEIAAREQKLTNQQRQLESQQQELTEQKTRLAAQNSKIDKQEQALEQDKKALKSLQTNFNQVNEALTKSQSELSTTSAKLTQLATDIETKEGLISSLENNIDHRRNLLANLEQQKEQQQQQLAKQSDVILVQYIGLIIALVVCSAIFVVLLVIYKSKKSQHKINQELQKNIHALAEANFNLSNTQQQLVESEKMAALGSLVAGVAHEINTPIGVSITAASHFKDRLSEFKKVFDIGQVKKSHLEQLLNDAHKSTNILLRNLDRASELISNFKEVAVDQSSENKREFELVAYIEEIVQSLRPQFKRQNHKITITTKSKIELINEPGVIAQIITNLIMNTIKHGFKDKEGGEIHISITAENNDVIVDYIDNGIGLSDQQREKVFEPFYTTARSSGGSGLGMSIAYNLVATKLHGTFKCLKADQGAHFQFMFPQSSH